MSKIGQFIDHPSFTSIEDLLKKTHHLADGAGLVSSDQSALWPALFDLPPHAEYDFDVRHFQSVTAENQIAPLTQALVSRNQFVAYAYSSANSPWTAEDGFVQSCLSQNRNAKPLILHFSCGLSECALQFQKRHGANVEIVHAGLQFHCTAREDIDQTLQYKMKISPLKEMDRLGILKSLESVTNVGFQQLTWIHFELNGLMASQGGTWATGLEMRELLPAMEWLMRQTRLQGLSIGPLPMTHDSLPAKTAAQLLATVLYAYSHRRIVSSAHGKRPSEIFS